MIVKVEVTLSFSLKSFKWASHFLHFRWMSSCAFCQTHL